MLFLFLDRVRRVHYVEEVKGVFGFLVFITHNSVSITYNSKMVEPMTQKLVWISITLFLVFVSFTQFSGF